MEDRFELTVNGEPRTVTASPDTTLLDVLRNRLGLVGSRFGCGQGLCGACFVLIDGTAVPSCDAPMWSADGRAVTTVEGLAEDGVPHPVQEAFLAEQAAQCGYCVSGMLISAAALLARDPHPDEGAVAAALDRHLCRCGAHQRMVRAVVRAGASAAPPDAAPDSAAQDGAATGGAPLLTRGPSYAESDKKGPFLA